MLRLQRKHNKDCYFEKKKIETQKEVEESHHPFRQLNNTNRMLNPDMTNGIRK